MDGPREGTTMRTGDGTPVAHYDDEVIDARIVGPIEMQWQRLDNACETLVETVTAVFDRFQGVMNTDERASLRDTLDKIQRDGRGVSTIAMRLDSHADLVERQVDRLRECIDRCEL